MQAELIVDARNAVGESPVWVPEENALYWVDIPAGGLQCGSATTVHVHAMKEQQMLACIPRHPERGFVAGMETAFRATTGQGRPRIALLAEMDALPGLGHACGHNIIGTAGAGAGIAAAALTYVLQTSLLGVRSANAPLQDL